MASTSPPRYSAMRTIAPSATIPVLDGRIANVALPIIARDVGASAANAV